jgi:hypothetical protein
VTGAGIGSVAALALGVALAGCHANSPVGPKADAGDANQRDEADEMSLDAPPGEALGHCVPGPNECVAGAVCVQGCIPRAYPGTGKPVGGLCTFPGRERCGCGIVPAPCTTPGFDCLSPACCDFEGLCVTPEEKAVICAGPDAFRFACGP